jgi:hypothetical protein
MAIADDAYRAHRAFTTAKTEVDQLAATTPAAMLDQSLFFLLALPTSAATACSTATARCSVLALVIGRPTCKSSGRAQS